MSEPTGSAEHATSRSHHRVLLACIAVLALSTCTAVPPGLYRDPNLTSFQGQQDAPPLPNLPEAEPVDGSGASLAQQGARQPVNGQAPGSDGEFAPIQTLQPTLRLSGDEASGSESVEAALSVEGVRFATAIGVGQLPVASSQGVTTVEAAVIEPHGFRVFTPQITADATDVWQRISEGDVALTHDTGRELDAELGERLPAGGDDGTVRIGAFASNGIPPVADAVMIADTAEEIDFAGRLELLVSLHPDADPDAVAADLTEATGLETETIEQPETQQADQQAAGHSQRGVPASSQQIEPFSYQSIGDGMIQIDPGWVQRHIVSANVPVFGTVTCHRAMIPQLRAALNEIVQRELTHLINTSQYGGCWVPRHIMFNPQRNLSMHAWGLAIDFNVASNQYGASPQLDPRIVETFQKWGFSWGGNWSTPDGMHFELRTLMNVPG